MRKGGSARRLAGPRSAPRLSLLAGPRSAPRLSLLAGPLWALRLSLLGSAVACGGGAGRLLPPAGAPPSAPAGAARQARPVALEELGLSLADLRPETPRDPGALAAFIAAEAGPVDVVVEAGEGGGEAEGLASIAAVLGVLGVSGVRGPLVDEEGAAPMAGEPPRVIPWALSALAIERLAHGEEALRATRYAEARAAFMSAWRIDGGIVAEPFAAVGDAYAREGRWHEAAATYEETVARFPWSLRGHLRLGMAVRELGSPARAFPALARAFALGPEEALVRRALAEDRRVQVAPSVLPPASPHGTGAVRRWIARVPPSDPQRLAEARAYAGCKEAFRRSERLREAAAGLRGSSWRWSPAEESACSVLWLASYLEGRRNGRVADPALDELIEIAREGELGPRSLFDLVARAAPGALLWLGDERRARLFAFVLRRRIARLDAGWGFP